MDGSIRALEAIPTSCEQHPRAACRPAKLGPAGQPDVMGYHTAREIPNYWAYARTFGLQDRMFAPSDSWTLPSHLYLVSAWSATCPRPMDPMSCRSDLELPGHNVARIGHIWTPADGAPRPYAWADITWLLSNAGVSWGYYVGRGTCVLPPCEPRQPPNTNPIQNPLPGFRTVKATDGFANITQHARFFETAAHGQPSGGVVDHVLVRRQRAPARLHLERTGMGHEGRERGDVRARKSSGSTPRSSSRGTTGEGSTITYRRSGSTRTATASGCPASSSAPGSARA